jgi:superfamily II DNA or RNA helicase
MFTPYDYQERIVDKTFNILEAQRKKPLIVLGTGGGKTAIAAMIALQTEGRVMICCCLVSLVMQFVDDLIMVGVPDEEIGILQGDNSDSPEYLSQCRVVVAMSQTLQTDRGADFLAANQFDLFIGDERHLGHIDIGEELVASSNIIGMTATPWKTDGDESLLDWHWIEEITMQEMINRGSLIDYDHYFYPADVESQICLEPEYVFNEWHRNLLGVPTLGFARTIDEAYDYAEYFTSRGYPCDVACDETPEDEFDAMRQDFRAGRLHVIFSVTKIATGFNEPIAKGLLACCKRTSLSLWVQMIGRIVRKDGTGRKGLLLDFFNNGRKLTDPRDIISWRDVPPAAGKTCQECGLKNSTKQVYCKGCGHCLISPEEKKELREAFKKEIDLDEYYRLQEPMVRGERSTGPLDRVAIAKAARETAFWDLNTDPAWAADVQKEHYPNEVPIVASQVLEGAIFPSGMAPKDLAAYVAYLDQFADRRKDPEAWIKEQVRAEGGGEAVDLLEMAFAA